MVEDTFVWTVRVPQSLAQRSPSLLLFPFHLPQAAFPFVLTYTLFKQLAYHYMSVAHVCFTESFSEFFDGTDTISLTFLSPSRHIIVA